MTLRRGGWGSRPRAVYSPWRWGDLALDWLHAGLSADNVAARRPGGPAARLPGADGAQLGIVAAGGGVAVVSGPRVEAEVSVARREDVCVAANLMEHPGVAERTVAAYDASATQPFPARLVAALAAADQTGGDLRGGQSAALRVVDPATPSATREAGVRSAARSICGSTTPANRSASYAG
ncbi:DUF1028 domain-containing protein [Parafrankia sp. Ea1.12]|uniref:DUF1028 domain-containing protein n=1 Tax=Parafrankia sp. Ea1.12 TaxID=573499 RepID=UPI000DD3DAB5